MWWATASRSPPSSVSGGRPDARSSSGWRTRGPAAAATRSTAWASALSASIRTIRVSRTFSGSRCPRPPEEAATSSSVKNGLPSARANRSSTSRASGLAEDAGDLAAHLLAREALEPEPGDGGRALGLGQEGAQRVAAVQLVRAVGGHDGDALAAGVADEERDEVARRAVGPVQV